MNVKRKQAAVNKYAPMHIQGVTVEELGNLLAEDEKGYNADEINEIRTAITEGQTEKSSAKPPAKKEETKEKAVVYEEWRMELVGKELQKLKKVRSNVKITEEEAETLNVGATSPGAVNPIMYFKSE